MKKYKIGYTQGTFDLFHVGHLNLLENAKEQCDYLIVGVNSDELVKNYKNRNVSIPEKDRARIVEALKVVDKVYIARTLDKKVIYEQLHYNAIFIGDDWKGNPRWVKTEENLAEFGVPVVYLPHTKGISTTLLTEKIQNRGNKQKEIGNQNGGKKPDNSGSDGR